MTGRQLGRWAPLSIPELAQILGQARFVWWIAGGHALDLFLGRTTRRHDDLDVEVLRRDQHRAQRLLTGLGWDMHVAADGRLRPWCPGECLTAGDNSVWCRPTTDEPWCVQLMLADSDNNNWRFRRNPAIIRSIESIRRRTTTGVPYLDPTIQLLFKAKNPRPKDTADFNAVLVALSSADRVWLASALATTHPHHPWLAELRSDSNQ